MSKNRTQSYGLGIYIYMLSILVIESKVNSIALRYFCRVNSQGSTDRVRCRLQLLLLYNSIGALCFGTKVYSLPAQVDLNRTAVTN
jgi:hypothetical protein